MMNKEEKKDWDLFVYGNYFEDEEGNRIDPKRVKYDPKKKVLIVSPEGK